MLFKYKAQSISGEFREGELDTADKFVLSRELKKQGLSILTASPAKTGISFFKRLNESVSTIKLKEKIFFASNLAEMISAGLPLSRALGVLERQSENKKLKTTIADITMTIDQGGTFASGLAKFPKIFSSVFVAMVGAGEKSGRLPESLKVISDQLEKTYTLRKKIKGALVYPCIIIIAMTLIAAVMLIYIVPTLAATFEDIGAELPFTTKVVIGASDLLASHPIIILLALIAVIYGFLKAIKTTTGKRIFAVVLLKFPVVKNITKEMNSALTARTLGSLIASGVEMVEALKITEDVLQNPFYKDILREAQIAVPKGSNLSKIFSDWEKYYPPFVSEMVSVGEETGKLSDMLKKLAQFYEDEVDAATKDLSTIIEPVIMILVGIAVGFFALSMIQPIYSIGNSI
ncbi:MAG TPA: type II secretion system F family protein [Candidatus Paceibacterota bacterium]